MSFDAGFIANHTTLLGSIVALGTGYLLLKRYTAGGWCYNHGNLSGKTILITGGNTGIGKETAQELAVRGAQVIIAVRDTTRGRQAAEDIFKKTGKSVHIKRLDLACLENVRDFAEDLRKDYDRLDILINNAGVMMCPYLRSADGYELHFATNHLGHFLLTNMLLDLLKKSAPSRIINVSALAHERGKIYFDDLNSEKDYNPWDAYCQSKLANVLFSLELSKRLKGTGVSVFSLHPGIVMTDLGRHILKQIPKLLLPAFSALTFPLLRLLWKTPRQGAQTSVHCAVEPELDTVSGGYFSDCRLQEPAVQARDEEAARQLWDASLAMVQKALGPIQL